MGNAEVADKDHQQKRDRSSRVVVYYGVVTDILNSTINMFNNLISSSNSRHGFGHGHLPNNILIQFLKKIEKNVDNFLKSMNKNHICRHPKCQHRYNCLIYPMLGFVQRFTAGYLLQAAVKLLGSASAIVKKPHLILKILKSTDNIDLGLFLGSYVFIFRVSSLITINWSKKNI